MTTEAEIKLALALERIDELENWKAQAMAVESEWDCQAVAQELGISLGRSIRAEIMPVVKRLKERVAELEATSRPFVDVIAQFPIDVSPSNPGLITSIECSKTRRLSISVKDCLQLSRALAKGNS